MVQLNITSKQPYRAQIAAAVEKLVAARGGERVVDTQEMVEAMLIQATFLAVEGGRPSDSSTEYRYSEKLGKWVVTFQNSLMRAPGFYHFDTLVEAVSAYPEGDLMALLLVPFGDSAK